VAPSARVTGFLRSLPVDDAEVFTASGARRTFSRGSALFLEGDRSDHAYLILSGRVKVFRTTPEGRELVLSVRGPGDVLGEMAAVDDVGTGRSASVFALEPVVARMLSGEELRALILARPAIGLALLSTLTRRLRDADRRRAEFGGYDTRTRVAHLLTELCPAALADDGSGTEAEVALDLALTQAEIAGLVGASRESVVRALTTLRARGLIRTGRRSITVVDPAGLRALDR
jgi:CRP-like cAMP-binding protein